jgi:NitT/TauT family transport system permease protein
VSADTAPSGTTSGADASSSSSGTASGQPPGDGGTRRRRPRSAPSSRASATDRVASLVLAAAIIGLAELAAINEWVSRLILPRPSQVAVSLWNGLESGIYWTHLLSTVRATVGGFLLAAITAVAIAGLLTSIPRAERILLPFIIAFQTVPKIAIAPLVILWLGFDDVGKTIIVTIVCFFPILVNALQGLRMRDRSQLELFQSLGASRWQLFRYVRIPNSLPYLFAGFHVAILFALIGAIVAEFVGSRAGLGFLMLQSRAQFDVPGFFAILIILMVIGTVLHRSMLLLERRIAFWSTDVTVVGA